MLDIIKKYFYAIVAFFYRKSILRDGHLKEIFERLDRIRPTSKFNQMVKIRQFEILLNGVPQRFQITGDSIIHIGEAYFERNGIVCSAIGGDTTESLSERLHDNVLPYLSDVVIIHIGGNDSLKGADEKISFSRFKSIVDTLYKAGAKRVAYISMIPLGNPATTDVQLVRDNYKLFHKINFEYAVNLNRMVKKLKNVDYIDVRSSLVDNSGWMSERYQLPDRIHVNDLAYTEIYEPAVVNYISQFV